MCRQIYLNIKNAQAKHVTPRKLLNPRKKDEENEKGEVGDTKERNERKKKMEKN